MTAAKEKSASPSPAAMLASLYTGLPQAALVVDPDMRVVLSNPAASRMFESTNPHLLWNRMGEVFACIHSREAGCGRTGGCGTCMISSAVREALETRVFQRRRAKVERLKDGGAREINLLVTAIPLVDQAEALVALLLEDIGELLSLPGLLPICASCKSVRTEGQVWESIEAHLNRRLDMDFSHSLCPTCAAKLYPPRE